MNFAKTLSSVFLLASFGTTSFNGFSQCEITSADSYLLTDSPVTLTATPEGGIFAGLGIIGDTFDPAAAGEGVHTITYVVPESGTGNIYYMQSNMGDPWGSPTNQELMDIAFGTDTWNLAHYETADAATLFSAETGFVHMDGGSLQASELADFLSTNLELIENWVFEGGRLFINSAPNEGGDINFGFDGTILNYEPPGEGTHATNVEISDLGHPSIFGPNLPISIEMSGTYYSHGILTGTDLNKIAINADSPDKIILAEKNWGAGRVMFGGLVSHNFQTPVVQVKNWRANLLFGLYHDYCTKEITVDGYANIEAQELKNNMYPNPAKQEVKFQLVSNTSVEIYSITGQQLLPPTLNLKSFDVSSIETGIYLVVFTNENSKTTQRLVVR